MCDSEIHDDRIREAAEQLCRYSGQPRFVEFAEALELLSEMNDDICNMRDPKLIRNTAEHVKKVIDKIVQLSEA